MLVLAAAAGILRQIYILKLNTKIALKCVKSATRGALSHLEITKVVCSRGTAPNTIVEAYNTPQIP